MCVAWASGEALKYSIAIENIALLMQHKHYLLSIICSSLRGLGRPHPELSPCVQYIKLE